MKRIALLLTLIVLAVAASGCTTPPEKNIHLNRVDITSTITKTVTSPYFTTVTVTRKETAMTTESLTHVTTTTKTVSNFTTYTSTITISSSGTTTITKTFTLYMNTLGDGKPNAVSFIIYRPTTKITYTVSGSITLTYTPYIEVNPLSTVYKKEQSIIIVPDGNTTTVYWPAASGTNPVVVKFFRGVFRWWDYLYIEKYHSLLPTRSDPLGLYLYMRAHYTYDTRRALSFDEFYLPDEFIQNGGGNDGDYAEFYAAMMYAEEKTCTIAILKYGANNYHFVFVTDGRVIDANTGYFANMQALVNVYGIDPTVSYVVIGTFKPIETIYTTTYTHQPIWFVNTMPSSIGITAVQTEVIDSTITTTEQYVGRISNNTINFTEISGQGIITFTGDATVITRWYFGEMTKYTVTPETLYFAGGRVTLVPTPLGIIMGIPFDNNIITEAIVTNHTTIVRGFDVENGTTTYFERTKVLSTENYKLVVIDGMYGITITSVTGTIYYSR